MWIDAQGVSRCTCVGRGVCGDDVANGLPMDCKYTTVFDGVAKELSASLLQTVKPVRRRVGAAAFVSPRACSALGGLYVAVCSSNGAALPIPLSNTARRSAHLVVFALGLGRGVART